jgi:pimeloyl-ACP methyl ester carboxylesterase
MLLWRRHRQLVDGLVLCATARRVGPGGVPARALAAGLVGASVAASPVLRSRMVRARLASVFGRSAAAPWVVEQVAPHDHTTLVQAGAALSGFDATRWLGTIDVPTTVVVTTRDTVVAPERQRALAEAIPGARVEEAAGGHAIVLDAPHAFVPVLVRALRTIETDARRRGSRPTPP